MTGPDIVLVGLEPANVAESPTTKEKLLDALPNDAAPAAAAAAHIQYKIVKVRKPDGTIVRVKRPITREESVKVPSTTSNANTSIKDTLSTSALQTSASPAQTPDQAVSTAGLPAKACNGGATTTKTTTKSSSEPAKQSATVSAQGSSHTLKNHALNIVASGGKIHGGISRLRHGSSRLVAAVAPVLDMYDSQLSDEELGEDSGSDLGSDSDIGDRREYAHKMNNSKSATKKTPPSAAKGMVTNEKEVPESHLESDASLNTSPNTSPSETEAKLLVKRYNHWSRYILWSIIIIFPVLFIAVGILTASTHRKRADLPWVIATQQALRVAISVWPIIFAGILGQSLRVYATYKVERGLRLMTLEQLLNSHSVASSIKQPFLFRRFNWVTIALLVLWGLSPLATQAMQRISPSPVYLDQKTSTIYGYMNTVNGSNILAAPDKSDEFQSDMNTLYSAAFLNDNNNYPGMDFFNNALIPIIPEPPNNIHPDSNWSIIDSDLTYNYSSFYGIPVTCSGLLSGTEWDSTTDVDPTFNITAKAAYLTFNCSDLNTTTMDEIGYKFPPNPLAGSTLQTLYIAMTPMNDTTNGTMAFASLISQNTTDPNNATAIDMSNANYTKTYAYSYCNFWQTFVEVNISCQDSNCATYAIRPDTPSPPYSFSGNHTDVAFMEAAGSTANGTATDTERYIMNGYVLSSNTTVNLTTLLPGDFTTRLSQVLNTYWQIGFGPANFTSPLSNQSFPSSYIQPAYGPGARIDNFPYCEISWGWFAALMVSSGFLLVASIASIIWDASTISPNILGFATSLLNTNHVQSHDLRPIPPVASGLERVRALGDVMVMMEDVKPKAKVGRMELRAVHPGAKRLEPGRSYC